MFTRSVLVSLVVMGSVSGLPVLAQPTQMPQRSPAEPAPASQSSTPPLQSNPNANAPKVNRITLAPVEPSRVNTAGQYAPGTRLVFTVEGTPKSQGRVKITGISSPITLKETSSGTYTAAFVVPKRGTLSQNTVVRVDLQKGEQSNTAQTRLGGPLTDNPQTAGATQTPTGNGTTGSTGTDPSINTGTSSEQAADKPLPANAGRSTTPVQGAEKTQKSTGNTGPR